MTFNPSNPTDYPDQTPGPPAGGWILAQSFGTNIPTTGLDVGPFYVGNVAATFISVTYGGSGATFVETLWTADQAKLQTIFGYDYYKSRFSPIIDVRPNQGPWFTLRFQNGSGGTIPNATYTIRAFAQFAPGQLIGSGTSNGEAGMLAFLPFQALGSGATAVVNPFLNVPGPAILSLQTTNSSVDAAIVAEAGPRAVNFLTGVTSTVGFTNSLAQQVIIPADDWQLQVTNRNAAGVNVIASVMTLR